MSRKCFTLELEKVFKKIDWGETELNTCGELLHYLMFANFIGLLSKLKAELLSMLQHRHNASQKIEARDKLS